MKKSILIVIGIIIAVVTGILIIGGKDEHYKEIKKYIEDNKNELELIAKEYINGEEAKLPKNVKTITSYKGNDTTIVEFYVKKEKKLTSSLEYGFYYSKTDTPVIVKTADEDLIQIGKDKWMWNNTEKDNQGITTKVSSNWYYYEITY